MDGIRYSSPELPDPACFKVEQAEAIKNSTETVTGTEIHIRVTGVGVTKVNVSYQLFAFRV